MHHPPKFSNSHRNKIVVVQCGNAAGTGASEVDCHAQRHFLKADLLRCCRRSRGGFPCFKRRAARKHMTAQAPERIIVDGRPRALYANPLYRLAKRCRIDLRNPHVWSTGNYRGYIGTWEIRDRKLCLVHLCWDGDGETPISEELRQRLFRAAQCNRFPIHAHWFTGVVRIAIGKRLVYSHLGWSHWFERERVIHFVGGEIVRDREVDTRAILERWLRRNPGGSDLLSGANPDPLGPLIWFDKDADSWEDDWWPPDYVRPSAPAA